MERGGGAGLLGLTAWIVKQSSTRLRFLLFTALMVVAASPAQAQYFPCPSFTAGWAVASPGDSDSPGGEGVIQCA